MSKIAIYQTGVDVLGFPTYVEHHIHRGANPLNKISQKKTFWVTVTEVFTKQF